MLTYIKYENGRELVHDGRNAVLAYRGLTLSGRLSPSGYFVDLDDGGNLSISDGWFY